MIWTAVVLGFLGSFHCLGMCGPIALAVTAADQRRFLMRKLWYNLGRVFTYGLLGLLVGTVGKGLQLAGFQQWTSILLGGLIIIMSILYKRSERAMVRGGAFRWIGRLKSLLGFWLKKGGTLAFFMTGLVNGLLPCGMVYIALLASLGLSDPLRGSMYMIAFGVGTIPLMWLLMMGGSLCGPLWRQRIFKLMPFFAVFIGALFIIRGLGLGIHFLSPELGTFEVMGATDEMTICR